jgi:hypothetical protein
MVARGHRVTLGRPCGQYAQSAGVTQIRPGRRLGVHWLNSVYERALSASDLGYTGENMRRKRGVRAPKTPHERV